MTDLLRVREAFAIPGAGGFPRVYTVGMLLDGGDPITKTHGRFMESATVAVEHATAAPGERRSLGHRATPAPGGPRTTPVPKGTLDTADDGPSEPEPATPEQVKADTEKSDLTKAAQNASKSSGITTASLPKTSK